MAKEIPVGKNAGGQKLFNFLKRAVTAENSEIHRWIRTGQVRINKKRASAFDPVQEGDLIRIPPFAELQNQKTEHGGKPIAESPKTADSTGYGRTTDRNSSQNGKNNLPIQEKFPFPIVYENEELLIVNKPQGIACQGGTGQKQNIADMLKAYYRHADFVPAPAHRLDKESQGLLLIGKSYGCLRFLTDFMKGGEQNLLNDMEQDPKKIYRAWVYGDIRNFARQNPYLCTYLFHDENAQKEQVYSAHGVKNAQEAKNILKMYGMHREILIGREKTKALFSLSTLKVLDVRQNKSLAEIGIYTGRKHQIRVQLAHFGFPLVGDKKYAPKKFLRENDRFFLQACRITLPENNFTELTVFTV